MGYYDIKLRRSDILFSLYLRAKRRWRCEYCGRMCRDFTGTTIFYKLETSHYFSRSHENTRYDEENCRVLCFTCHKRMGGHTREENGEYDLWMKKLLGEQRYKMLCVRANTYRQKDEKLALLYVKQLIKNQDG